MIVCPAHKNITYNTISSCEKNKKAEYQVFQQKLLIIQKQMEDIENGQELEMDLDAQSAGTVDEEDSQSVASEIQSVSSESSKKRKVEFIESRYECEGYLKELNYEKKMNAELVKQNDELRDHNTFLRNLKESAMTNTQLNNGSF